MTAAKRWRAPAEDGGVLVDPPFAEVPRLLEENRERLAADCLILGRPLREWREDNLRFVSHLAQGMWSPVGSSRPEWKSAPLVLAGHQPELFHPGVWVKNFTINRLAQKNGLNPLHLSIDTDTIKTTEVRLPVWDSDPANVRSIEIAFDRWDKEVPYESRYILDRQQFRSFAARAMEVCDSWQFEPILPRLWDDATQHFNKYAKLRHPPTMGDCLSVARRRVEQSWGCANFELPLSCVLVSASAFIAQVLSDLPRFHAVYNECLREYRRKHGLRSRTHPVPDLASYGDLLEAPFWLHGSKSGRLGRLFVRRHGDRLDLHFRPDSDPTTVSPRAEHPFLEMSKRGLFIQTRALTTTMFARLFLCDLFIHGIGGGIYDELTDTIIRRYFGIEPPHYMVVSGTLRLPLPTFPATPATCRQLQRELRDLDWNPQRYIDAGELAQQREQWRTSQPADSAGRRERFRALQALTTQIRQMVPAEECTRREQRLERCEQELAANAILRNREYAFCLYPEEKLRPFCTQFLDPK